MKTINYWLAIGISALALNSGTLTAQERQGNQERPNLRNLDWQNMDPKEIQKVMQERMMEMFRDRLEVKDDAEWKIISERLGKVTQARMETFAGGFGMGGFGGGAGGGGGRGFQSLFGEPSAEAKALQEAIDSKAPSAELKEKLAKVRELRKQKQANLVKAQEELRKVLSPRQEAIAVMMGTLD